MIPTKKPFIIAAIIWWVSCTSSLSFPIDKWDENSVSSRLETVLNNFDYYDLKATLTELDKNSEQSKIFSEIVIIFHTLRISNVDPDQSLINLLGKKFNFGKICLKKNLQN